MIIDILQAEFPQRDNIFYTGNIVTMNGNAVLVIGEGNRCGEFKGIILKGNVTPALEICERFDKSCYKQFYGEIKIRL